MRKGGFKKGRLKPEFWVFRRPFVFQAAFAISCLYDSLNIQGLKQSRPQPADTVFVSQYACS